MKNQLVFVLAMVVLFQVQVQTAQINSNWVGGEGEYGYWDQTSNWNPAVRPNNGAGDTFNVTIDSNSIVLNEAYVILQTDNTIDQLICDGVVILGKSGFGRVKLHIVGPNGLSNHGELWMWSEGYNMAINGNVINHGNMRTECDIWNDVTNKTGAYMFLSDMEIRNGNLVNDTDARLEIEEMVIVGYGSFTNDGWTFIIPSSTLWVSGGFTNNGMINMKGGEIANDNEDGIAENFVNTSSGKIWGSGAVYTGANFVNKGSITASSGNLTVFNIYPEYEIINTGKLENDVGSSLHLLTGINGVSNHGTIIINAIGSVTVKLEPLFTEPNNCILSNDPNGTIQLLGGTLSANSIVQKENAIFEGFGGITGNVVIDPNGIIKLTGSTNVVGDITIGTNATLEISDGTTLITGHTTNNGTIHMKGGRIIPQGGITNNGNVIWEPGIYNNVADFNLDGQVNLLDFADFSETWLWEAQL